MGLSLIHASVLGFGTAAASGTVQFYAVGTLTPVITFSDDAGTQPLSGALALGATGAPSTAVYTATPLRAIVKSSAGSTLQDISRIDGDRAELVQVSNSAFTATNLNDILTAIQSSTGGIDAQFFGTYSSVATSLKFEIEAIGLTPQRYGAKGNGVSDDTAAFLLMAAAFATSGYPIFIPKGTYNISSVITFGANAFIEGAGEFASIIVQTSAGAGGFIVGTNSYLSNLAIKTNIGSTGTGIAAGSQSYLVNVATSGTGSWTIGLSGNNLAIRGKSAIAGTTGLSGTNASYDPTASISGGTLPTSTFILSPNTPPQTQDMIATGNVTPIFNGGVSYNRIRITTTGTGTVNAVTPTNANASHIMTLDCVNTSGGGSTFTMNAIYKTGSAITPTAGLRIVVTFVWAPSDSLWIETGRTGGTAGF